MDKRNGVSFSSFTEQKKQEVRAAGGSAVQIVNVKKIPNRPSQFVLEKTPLRQILKEVGDRNVCVLSIAGASRQGKSFLMNVIRHYLEEMEMEAESPWDNICRLDSLDGFHIENRNVRDTIGFWMWSKPFIFKQSNGKEIAVLLMDTQGVFDQYSTKREWGMIVGLSMLTSSCVIYNLLNNLQEDNLEIVSNFVEFGMLTLEKDQTATSAFQKLLFLIRDWQFPNDTAYGSVGGSQFLHSKLAVHPDMPEDLKKVREKLRFVFEEIECFLMPNPGDAARQNDFAGSLKKLDPTFLNHLEEFLSNLLIIDDLPSLKIAGQEIQGRHLATYFAKYVDLLNKQEGPNAKAMYEASSEASLDGVTLEYVNQVKSEIEDMIKREDFLVDVQLKQEYERSCKQAFSKFRDNYQGKERSFLVQYSEILFQQLKDLFNVLNANNEECKKDFIGRLLKQTESDFNQQVASTVKGTTQTAADMEILLDECKEKIIQNLDLGNRPKDFFDDLFPQLHLLMEELASVFRQKNAESLKSLESTYRVHFESLLKNYEEMIEMVCPSEELPSMTPERLLKAHKRCEDCIIKKLLETATFENSRLKDKAVEELKSLTAEKVSGRLKVVEENRNEADSQALELVQRAVYEYCEKMNDFFARNKKPTEEGLNMEHRFAKSDASEVMSKVSCIMRDLMEVQKVKEILDEKIAESFRMFKTKLEEDKQQFIQSWKSAVSNAKLAYETEILKFVNALPHPGEDKFMQKKQAIGSSIVSKTVATFSLSDQENLKMEIEREYKLMDERIRTSYKSIIKDSQATCADDAKRVAEDYARKLKEILDQSGDQMTPIRFDDMSQKVMNDLKLAFESKWMKTISTTDLSHVFNELVSDMNKIDSKLSDELEEKVHKLESLFQNIIEECCDLYTSEMDEKLDDVADLRVVERVHKACFKKAEKEMTKQMKEYASFPQARETMEKFHKQIMQLYRDKMEHIQENLEGFNNFLERTQQASVDIYRKHFARERANISSEEQFKTTHEEGLKLASKCLKQKMATDKSITVSVSDYYEQESKLEATLEQELETQKQEWRSMNDAIDEQTKKVIQDLMERYQNSMADFLGKLDFHSDANLQNKHEKLLEEALKKISETKKPQNADPKVYEHQVITELSNILVCFQNENEEKRRKVCTEVTKYVVDRRNDYSKWLSSNKLPKKKMMEDERSKHVEGLQKFCYEQFKTPGSVSEDFLNSSKEELSKALDAVEAEWNLLEPHEAELELSINKARKIYQQEMDSHVKANSPLLPFADLKRHHNKASAKASRDFETRVKQTPNAVKRLQQAIEVAFMRYRDENDAKAADAGDVAIGIDLGTTYSCVAVYRKGKVEIIPERNHHKATVPSYVLFQSKDKYEVGETAKDQSVIYPKNTVFDSKRLIGRRFDDKEVQEDLKLWPFRVMNDNSRPKIVVHGESYYPEEISGKILTHLKENAEKHLGHEVKRAVITVPAYFTDAQKRATRAAADFAGLEVLELLAEPTAAAIAYNFHYDDGKGRNTFVYDLGGGTFDVSILVSKMGIMEAKGVDGDSHLGGQDFDNALVKYCIDEFNKKHGVYLENEGDQNETDGRIRRIRNRCENAKINLSISDKAKVIIDRLCGDKDMDVEITRAEFNRMIEPMLQKTIRVAKSALDRAQLKEEDISDVVLVGGSSRIPRAQELLKELFNREGLNMTLNPDEVVALGAAYRAAMLSGAKNRKALGDIKFTNVTPFALGTGIIGDRLSIIIPKNTQVPCKHVKSYYTTKNNQTTITFEIYEGEDPTASNNNLLGEFDLTNIPPAPQGKEPVDVTMELDEEGLLNVTAVIRSTRGSKDIKIETMRAGLTEDEIAEHKAK